MIRWARRRDLRTLGLCRSDPRLIALKDNGKRWREYWLVEQCRFGSTSQAYRHAPHCELTGDVQLLLADMVSAAAPGARLVIAAEYDMRWKCNWRSAILQFGLLSEGPSRNDPLPGDVRVNAEWLSSDMLMSEPRSDARLFSIGLTLRKPYSHADIETRQFVVSRCAAPDPFADGGTTSSACFPLPHSISETASFDAADIGRAFNVSSHDALGLLNELVSIGVAVEIA